MAPKKSYIYKFIGVILISLLIYLGPIVARCNAGDSGIGASPAYIRNDNLLPGSSFEEEIILSRSNPDKDAQAVIEIDAKDIASWITLNPGSIVSLPQGEERVSMKVSIKVPSDAKIGSYVGYLRIKLQEVSSGGQIQVIPAVRLDVNLTVVNTEYKVIKVQLAQIYDYIISDPLTLQLKIKNEGNVDAEPSKVKVDVKSLNNTPIATLESTNIPTVKAFAIDEVTVTFTNPGLVLGDYFADVYVYDGTQQLYKDTITFTVLGQSEDVTITTTGAADTTRLLGQILVIVGVILLIVSIIVGLIYFLFLKKNAKKREGSFVSLTGQREENKKN